MSEELAPKTSSTEIVAVGYITLVAQPGAWEWGHAQDPSQPFWSKEEALEAFAANHTAGQTGDLTFAIARADEMMIKAGHHFTAYHWYPLVVVDGQWTIGPEEARREVVITTDE